MRKLISPHHPLNLTEAMAVNESPAGVINTTPVAGIRSYFRSKIISSTIGVNPLLAAANPLLICFRHLQNLKKIERIEQLHKDLCHEIQAFESSAKEQGYSLETIVIARYALCATLDEIISYGHSNNRALWQHYKLLPTFQKEQSADERFFLILQRLLTAPLAQIDLLELFYHCLDAGFNGKYRYQENKEHGEHTLSLLMDDIYRQIRQIRQDPPRLPLPTMDSHKPQNPIEKNQHSKKPKTTLKSVLSKTTSLTLLGTALIYGGFAFIYWHTSQPIQHQIHALSQIISTTSNSHNY